jgi:hypothetical protein
VEVRRAEGAPAGCDLRRQRHRDGEASTGFGYGDDTAGVPAVITLPDGARVDGELATVGGVATAGADERQPATIEVTVTVPDQSRLGTLDQAPVAVALTSATAANVLTVPVAALVALAEGGYGVQVVTGSSVHYVAVQLGMFANGRVEISGDGITEGTTVGVPA